MHLSQRMSLSQVLAPQLQQSLALLQAATLELRTLVEQELSQNPLLEEIPAPDTDQTEGKTDDSSEEGPAASLDPAEPPADTQVDNQSEAPAEKEGSERQHDFQAEFEKLVQEDQQWRDVFSASNGPVRQSEEAEEKRQFMFESLTSTTSLQEDMLEQVRTSDLAEADWPLAELIIGNIDERGYCRVQMADLASLTGQKAEKLVEVLKVIQTFQPAGIAARDIRECLMLQLERRGKKESLEYQVVSEHMEALLKRRLPEIARGCGVEVDEIQDVLEEIGKLEPQPGRQFLPDENRYIVPEVFVTRVGDDFVVSTNEEHIPHLRISNAYKDLMARGDAGSEVREYIREKIRAGKFLIKSIHQRQQTITNIAKEIVKRQWDFMDKGVAFLKPLTMVQVAEVVGVHETTVSRAVSGKYVQTPQGTFDMKYFFTSGLQTDDGAGVSNTSVKDMISDIFKAENTGKPLSDQEVVKMLKEKGIILARRTVAKYRGELNIMPSNLRKQY